MPIPTNFKKYVDQTPTERLIDKIIDNDKPLSQRDLNRVYCRAQVDYRIEKYRCSVDEMTREDLLAEEHDSLILAQHMAMIGDPRPHKLAECHAIIAGRHPGASIARLIMAKMGRRIDDHVNGCWLPKNTAAIVYMPKRLSKAVSHRRIHRQKYYLWLNTCITLVTVKSVADLDRILTDVSFKLQTGSFPSWVMLPKNAELPL